MKVRSVLICAAAASSLFLGAKELYPAGDFEGSTLAAPLSVRKFVANPKRIAAPAGTVTEKIQSEKALNGKQSLLLEAQENGIHELNLHHVKIVPGKKYKFSVSYLVEEAAPKTLISARLLQLRTQGKGKYIFTNGKFVKGKVMQLASEFTAVDNAQSVSVTLWVNNGPYKVYIDDFKLTEVEESAPTAAVPANK